MRAGKFCILYLNIKSFGQSLSFVAALSVVLSCQEQSNLGQRKTDQQKILKDMDDQQYSRVVSRIEKSLDPDANDPLWQQYRIQSYLGLGDFRLSAILTRVHSGRSFSTSAANPSFSMTQDATRYQSIRGSCLQGAWQSGQALPLLCGLIRVAEALPPLRTQPLLRAQELWAEFERKFEKTWELQILEGTFHLARVVQDMAEVLLYYSQYRNRMTDSNYRDLFQQVARFAETNQRFLEVMKKTDATLFDRLLGADAPDVIRRNGETVEFLEETGIPVLLRISDLNNEDIEDRVGRVFLVQELDSLLRDGLGIDVNSR